MARAKVLSGLCWTPPALANGLLYVRNAKGEETVAWNSAVFQAILLAAKAIIGRPQYLYDGRGEERRCTVQVLDAQTREWQELQTPPLKKCRKNLIRSKTWTASGW